MFHERIATRNNMQIIMIFTWPNRIATQGRKNRFLCLLKIKLIYDTIAALFVGIFLLSVLGMYSTAVKCFLFKIFSHLLGFLIVRKGLCHTTQTIRYLNRVRYSDITLCITKIVDIINGSWSTLTSNEI